MDGSYVAYVSDQWLRTFIYEQGKGGGADFSSESHSLRLAEARAALRSGPRGPLERQRMAADSELETLRIQSSAVSSQFVPST
jgi:hypothetical protein